MFDNGYLACIFKNHIGEKGNNNIQFNKSVTALTFYEFDNDFHKDLFP